MEIKIIEKTENELRAEIKGENHTLLNALKVALLENEDVKIATYDIEHITISDPVLYIMTAEESPIKALIKACERLKAQMVEFKEAFAAE